MRTLQTGRKANLSSLFLSEWKLILYLTTMYVHCVYPAISKSHKTTTKLSENNWNKPRSDRFNWRYLRGSGLYCYRFFLSLYLNPVPEMLYLVHDIITPIFILSPVLVLKMTQLQDKCPSFKTMKHLWSASSSMSIRVRVKDNSQTFHLWSGNLTNLITKTCDGQWS